MRALRILIALVAFCSVSTFADTYSPTLISGTAIQRASTGTQRVSLSSFAPFVTGAFNNPGLRAFSNCVLGQVCQVEQTIDVFFTPYNQTAIYGFDFANITITFDLATVDPVTSLDLSQSMFMVGSFTGTLGFYDCAPGVDCAYNTWAALSRGCTDGSDCSPIPVQTCGVQGDAACTFNISGDVEGFTSTSTGPADRTYNFLGEATIVPEPASIFLMSTGLLSIGIRKKLRR